MKQHTWTLKLKNEQLLLCVLGILSVLLLPRLPNLSVLCALSSLMLVVAGLAVRFSVASQPLERIIFAVFSLVFGLVLGTAQIHWVLERQLPQSCDRMEVVAEFKIVTVLAGTDRSQSFEARLEGLAPIVEGQSQEASDDLLNKQCPARAQQWFSGKKLRVTWYQPPDLKAGQRWRAQLKLKRPRGLVNPGGFDYQAWLLSQGFGLVASLGERSSVRLLEQSKPKAFDSFKSTLRAKLSAENTHNRRFFLALALGDRSELSSEDWALMQGTGTVHLMAISGLHVGFIAWLGFLCGGLIVRLAVALPLDTSKCLRFTPAITSTLLAFFYSVLAGFTIPTLRAFIAVFVVNVCVVAGVRIFAYRAVLIALFFVVLVTPLAGLNQGFWLSFLAVFILMYGLRPVAKRVSKFVQLLRMQVLLGLGLCSILVLFGQPVSLISALANLIAVPVITVVVVPLLLLVAVLPESISSLLIILLDTVFACLWWILEHLDQPKTFLWWPQSPLTLFHCMVLSAVLAVLFLPKGLLHRLLPGALIIALLFGRSSNDYQSLKMTVLDVGQGLAVVVHYQDYHLLYDTGAHFSPRFNIGDRVISPYLRRQGVHSLDVIVSHADGDHRGGLPAIHTYFEIDRELHGEPLALTEAACHAGQSWQVDQLSVEVLWPKKNDHYSGNNASCVLKLQFGKNTLLLMGDVERHVERELLASGLLPRNATLLIAPHHGSKTSSSAAFLAHTRPEYVVFSAGYKNSYRHPHPSVVERYHKYGATTYTTGDKGAVLFEWSSPSAPPIVTSAREKYVRPWFD